MAIAQPTGWMADVKSLAKRVSALETRSFGRSGRNWGNGRARDDDAIVMSDESGDLALNTWITDQGPTISGIVVANGNLDIDITAKMLAEGITPIDLYVGANVTGPTNVTPSMGSGLYIRFDASSGQSAVQQATYGLWLTGLTPGTYSVSLAYFTGSIGSPTGSGTVSGRALKVQPY